MFTSTQQYRPSLQEAAHEAILGPDTHWTSNLSRIGMTRISRQVVTGLYVGTDLFAALELVALSDHGFLAK